MPLQVRAFSFAKGGLVAARALHQSLLTAVMALPAAFFDATPSGRILNRFSSDTGASLPGLLMQQALYKSCNAITARLVPHPSTASSLETTLASMHPLCPPRSCGRRLAPVHPEYSSQQPLQCHGGGVGSVRCPALPAGGTGASHCCLQASCPLILLLDRPYFLQQLWLQLRSPGTAGLHRSTTARPRASCGG